MKTAEPYTITTSERLKGVGEYYFSQKLREIEQLNLQGRQIINLGIGSPDLPPHPEVIKVLQEESAKFNVHSYQNYKGLPVLRKAISAWYSKYFLTYLNPDKEILPLIGSKEGLMHVCMTYVNAGDYVLVPNPGYPTYTSAAKLSGGQVMEYTLSEEKNWYPDFEQLEKLVHKIYSVSDQSQIVMFVNYPHMPTGQPALKDVFEKLINFAHKYSILICHDNPYSFILSNQQESILSIVGAMEVAIELNSLSKSHNMAGWRVGMLCGSEQRINEVLRFKSNMDSGMFLPVQLAAAKALSLNASWFSSLNEEYKERRQKVFELLNILGCTYNKHQSGMFVWAKIPSLYTNGYKLSDEVLYQQNVFITPGGIFGTEGNRYIRISLCNTVEKINEAINNIK